MNRLKVLWNAMRSYALPTSIMPTLIGAVVTLSACSSDRSSVVGLLDQIPELAPAGPWRVVVDIASVTDELLGGLRITATGLRFDEKGPAGQGQPVELAVGVDVAEGEILLCALESSGPVSHDVPMVVVLSGRDDSIRTEVAVKGRTQFRLAAPKGGAEKLAIRFPLPTDRAVPFSSIRILSMPPECYEEERTRAWLLNAAAGYGSGGATNEMLVLRKFPLQLEGVTRDCIVLVGEDTLSLDLPEPTGGAKVEFWSVAFRREQGLRVEIRREGEWREAPLGDAGGSSDGPWRNHALDLPLPNGCDSLRIISEGRYFDLTAVGEPVMVTRNRGQSDMCNVILVDLDTMRADRLGSYGYTARPTSDRLDSAARAKGFFVFRHAYSAAPHTLAATAKFMTSRYLDIHKAHALPRQYTTLAEVLRSHGYYCAAFTSGGSLCSPGLEQGFHEYHYCPRGEGKVEEVFPSVCDWLARKPSSPFFLFVHTYESHTPYTRDTFCRGLARGRLGDLSKGERLFPPDMDSWRRKELSPAERTYVQAAYDGGVATACDATADLFRLLESLHLWSRSTVVVLSDHGEEFWDHSDRYACHLPSSVYGELLNVPFFLFTPHPTGRGMTQIDAPVSTVDLVPTVCDLLGIEPPPACDGVSLAPLLERKPLLREVPVLATNVWRESSMQRAWSVRRACLISETRKYIEALEDGYGGGPKETDPYSREPALYFLDTDPGERQNRLHETPEIAQMTADSLHAALERAEKPLELGAPTSAFSPGADLREQLRLLGYMVDPDQAPEGRTGSR